MASWTKSRREGLCITAVTVGSLLGICLCFINVTYAASILGVCAYAVGHGLLRYQTLPLPLALRVAVAAFLFLCTAVITTSPWLVFGGMNGCRAFDPRMKTVFGYSFEEYWNLLWFRAGCTWIVTAFSMFSVLADHASSAYIRDCIRCCLYLGRTSSSF